MSRQRRPRRAQTALAAGMVAALAGTGLAACSRDEPPPPAPSPPSVPQGPAAVTSTPTSGGKAPILVNAVEPARALLPATISDEYGQRVGSLIYRGLLRYDAKGRLVNEVAEDIAAEGPTLYRVRVRKGWFFGNGEPVTAASFVDAWNFAASPACRQLNAAAFAPIAGFRALRGLPEPPTATPTGTAQPTAGSTTAPSASPTGAEPGPTVSGTPSASGSPTAPVAAPAPSLPDVPDTPCGPTARRQLAGLRVVDDLEFTVRLAQPDATFRDRLATLAYAPLPRVALADPASAATAPIGNGPYQLAGGWSDGRELRLIPNASYSGSDPAHNGGVTFRFFPDPAMSYQALQRGRLEVLDDTPLTALGRYKSDLGFRAANQPIGAASSLVFPMAAPGWATREGLQLRRAISRAIDRKGLAEGLYAGTRTPAGDLAAPGVSGYAPDLCGDYCSHDPKAAAELLPPASPVPPLEIAYSPEEGGLPAVQALCGAITSALRISCSPHAVPRDPATGATLATAAARHELTIPMLSTHRMARPDLGGFLSPRFLAGSTENPSGYAGAAAQALLAKAAATTDGDARMAVYRDAEKAILADLPEIPLWYVNATTGAAAHMQQVRIDVFGVPIYTELNRS